MMVFFSCVPFMNPAVLIFCFLHFYMLSFFFFAVSLFLGMITVFFSLEEQTLILCVPEDTSWECVSHRLYAFQSVTEVLVPPALAAADAGGRWVTVLTRY